MIDDFHYYCTAVLARAGGFSKEDALTIAYASQYVDDATEGKPIIVGDNFFDPARTAHMGLLTFDWSIQKRVYLPFHFLPEMPFEPHASRFIVRAGSPFARMLLEQAAAEPDDRFRLFRAGIAAHTFADTFAHEGFSGRRHRENSVRRLEVFRDGEWRRQDALTRLIRIGPRIGHVKAGALPDTPFAKWRYVSPLDGKTVLRDNPEIYLRAAYEVYEYFRSLPKPYKGKPMPWKEIGGTIGSIFAEARFGLKMRCAVWRETFGGMFKPLKYKYNKYRWRARALGVRKSETHWDGKPSRVYFRSHRFPFREDFFTSDWVMFHKAALKQRHFVLEGLL